MLRMRSQYHRRKPVDWPVKVCAMVYRDANRGDLIGYLQAIADALETAGVVENDRLIVSWDGSRMLVDRANPRVEIELVAVDFCTAERGDE